jgi:DNA gyrase subunit A
VLNQLFAYSPMQTSFGVNMLALNRQAGADGLAKMLQAFISFREQVVAPDQVPSGEGAQAWHETVGLAIAVANIDEMIKLIRREPRSGIGARALVGA